MNSRMLLAQSTQHQASIYTNTRSKMNPINKTENAAISIWWFLPFMAVPVFFIAFQKNNDEGHNSYIDREKMAGLKGGRSEFIEDEYEEAL